MSSISILAKFLIFLGMVIFGIGILLLFFGKIPYLGKLPGDILIKKNNFTFYFPITTSIILSILLTLILKFILRR